MTTENLPAAPAVSNPDQAMLLLSATWLTTRLTRMTTWNGKQTLPHAMAMSEAQRREIEAAERGLRSSLEAKPARKAVSVELARIIAAFPMANGTPEATTKLRMDGYVTAVSDIPEWALHRAVDDVLRGEAGLDSRFAPTPPQLAELAHGHMKPVREAAVKLRRLLDAHVDDPEPDPAERARMARRMEAWKSELQRTA